MGDFIFADQAVSIIPYGIQINVFVIGKKVSGAIGQQPATLNAVLPLLVLAFRSMFFVVLRSKNPVWSFS